MPEQQANSPLHLPPDILISTDGSTNDSLKVIRSRDIEGSPETRQQEKNKELAFAQPTPEHLADQLDIFFSTLDSDELVTPCPEGNLIAYQAGENRNLPWKRVSPKQAWSQRDSHNYVMYLQLTKPLPYDVVAVNIPYNARVTDDERRHIVHNFIGLASPALFHSQVDSNTVPATFIPHSDLQTRLTNAFTDPDFMTQLDNSSYKPSFKEPYRTWVYERQKIHITDGLPTTIQAHDGTKVTTFANLIHRRILMAAGRTPEWLLQRRAEGEQIHNRADQMIQDLEKQIIGEPFTTAGEKLREALRRLQQSTDETSVPPNLSASLGRTRLSKETSIEPRLRFKDLFNSEQTTGMLRALLIATQRSNPEDFKNVVVKHDGWILSWAIGPSNKQRWPDQQAKIQSGSEPQPFILAGVAVICDKYPHLLFNLDFYQSGYDHPLAAIYDTLTNATQSDALTFASCNIQEIRLKDPPRS